jgi:hypothetical protein
MGQQFRPEGLRLSTGQACQPLLANAVGAGLYRIAMGAGLTADADVVDRVADAGILYRIATACHAVRPTPDQL